MEVLTDGASAVYGTDAVAGVINVITKRNFQGAEISFTNDTSRASIPTVSGRPASPPASVTWPRTASTSTVRSTCTAATRFR